ncbi:hypothetical protein [Wolbachia endosymbiont (group A) of Rhinocyllus conicus]|uniref:hypothetical protein n=1 Tax=Wolbachia endosymbiont (group A) of Rhinocyllus conicus TaxID=2954053 RepID=UPI00222660A2|nr:hypothetical protein [Wolbachia endosymbiont (group A) of Rhinocyllus conicus]
MGYEKILLASIEERDPHKGSKELEIKRWCSAYWPLMESWGERKALFFQNVFSDETCWEVESASDQVKLNRYTVGKKLLSLKAEDGQKSLLSNFDRYRIACWCCFEDEIRAIFEEFKLTLGSKPVESLVKGCNKGALMIYWSHAMNNQEHQLKLNNEHPYVYAFKCAMLEKHVEALEFFWDKLQSIDSLSLERKEDLLMQAAYNKGNFSTDDVGMADFCLRHLHDDKYPELLKRDFKQHRCYYTLSILRRNHSFENARKLFEHLKPEDLSPEGYSTSMFSALNSLVSAPDDNFVKSGSDMLASMWNSPGFEAHRQHYLHNLSIRLSSRDLIVHLIKENKAVKVLSEIVNSLIPEQMQSIRKLNKSEYEVFTEVRNKQLDGGAGDSTVPSSLLDVEVVQQEVTDVRSKV